ncbi:MAG TPA: nicotinate-nucleotide adenylyltransferase [Candidatus Angelobacter sp.]|nr:nicotinate-nucleotide adenylyltransferase [Candidatus Angelobacter sp.]
MRIGLFGGTFDPIHRGHIAVARAAMEQFDLGLVYLAPADIPPHKQKRKLTDFQHRFAMAALAAADDRRLVPSLLDAHTGQPNYSIESVRRLKSSLKKADKVFFIIGMDAFKDISTWREPEALLAQCEFIVASRPGFSLAEVRQALPERLRNSSELRQSRDREGGSISIGSVRIHLLPELNEAVSSTQIREAVRTPGAQLGRYVPHLVAEYIRKEGLYLTAEEEARQEAGSKVVSVERRRERQARPQ